MRVAIQKHAVPGNSSASTYSKRWIEYCRENDVPYGEVNCYDTDIIRRLSEYDALLWNFDHKNPTDLLMARHVLFSAEQMGLVTFPDFETCWHFDDKLAQKYLMEAIGIAQVQTDAFFEKKAAKDWLRHARFPLVAKLRRGAGSYNVLLLNDYGEAAKYCDKMFDRGALPLPGYFADFYRKIGSINSPRRFLTKVANFRRTYSMQTDVRKRISPEKGYVLFQEFLPDNKYDTRISVIGKRAFGFLRGVRKNDWRASGSGTIDYDTSKIDMECVAKAFAVTRKLKSQSMAFDFVKDRSGEQRIVEISYGFVPEAVHKVNGYWDDALNWHDGQVWPEHAMIEDVIRSVKEKHNGQAT